jgi:hypothetical protein
LTTSLTDALEDALFEADCDDAGLGSCEAVVSFDFERKGELLGQAINSVTGAPASRSLA